MKLSLVFIIMLALSCPAMAENDCGHVDEIMNKAGEKAAQAGVEIYDEMVKVPEESKSFMEKCLGGILSGTGITLGIPDLSSLLNKVCAAARSEISNTLRSTAQRQSISALDGLVSGTVSSSTSGTSNGGYNTSNDVRVVDTSSAVRDSIWDAIKN